MEVVLATELPSIWPAVFAHSSLARPAVEATIRLHANRDLNSLSLGATPARCPGCSLRAGFKKWARYFHFPSNKPPRSTSTCASSHLTLIYTTTTTTTTTTTPPTLCHYDGTSQRPGYYRRAAGERSHPTTSPLPSPERERAGPLLGFLTRFTLMSLGQQEPADSEQDSLLPQAAAPAPSAVRSPFLQATCWQSECTQRWGG